MPLFGGPGSTTRSCCGSSTTSTTSCSSSRCSTVCPTCAGRRSRLSAKRSTSAPWRPSARAELFAAAQSGDAAPFPRGSRRPGRRSGLRIPKDIESVKPAALPFLAAALRRHLEEFPWTTDGLSRTERRILQALERGPLPLAELLRESKRSRPSLATPSSHGTCAGSKKRDLLEGKRSAPLSRAGSAAMKSRTSGCAGTRRQAAWFPSHAFQRRRAASTSSPAVSPTGPTPPAARSSAAAPCRCTPRTSALSPE